MGKCCICGCRLDGYGNNPQGACWRDENGKIVEAKFREGARCCNECDERYVIPGRIYRMQKARKKEGGK